MSRVLSISPNSSASPPISAHLMTVLHLHPGFLLPLPHTLDQSNPVGLGGWLPCHLTAHRVLLPCISLGPHEPCKAALVLPARHPAWALLLWVLVGVAIQSLSLVQLLVTPQTVACQAPLSMGFPRQEYWGGLPFPSPGDLPDPGSKPGSNLGLLHWQAESLPLNHWAACLSYTWSQMQTLSHSEILVLRPEAQIRGRRGALLCSEPCQHLSSCCFYDDCSCSSLGMFIVPRQQEWTSFFTWKLDL